jgi:hypothetical protein
MKMMRTPFVALAACAAAAAVMGAAPVFAGEVTGTGKDTQGPAHSNSICAFSGLNDIPEGAPGNPPGKTQNYGHTMLLFDIVARFFNPGDACNPHAPPPE